LTLGLCHGYRALGCALVTRSCQPAFMPLNRLTSLFRARAIVDPDELKNYSDALRPVAERLGALYGRWRQDLELISREDELANAASIQRWEAAGLLDRLRALEPPSSLAREHGVLEALLLETVRASQLLSNGYRFCSSSARCDGHALMLECQERFETLSANLAQSGVSVTNGGAAGSG
jgi:hypothetical protein